MKRWIGPWLLILALILTNCSSQNSENEPQTLQPLEPQTAVRPVSAKDLKVVQGQAVYVPVYSEIYFANKENTWKLAATLAIHNTNSDRPIFIKSIRYYDTDGNFVSEYVEDTLELAPLGTMGILLERGDTRGGVGANFIVEWAANTQVYEPVIEAVMVSTIGTQGLGFSTASKVISGASLVLSRGQTVYVPAYSEIFFDNREKTWSLTVTLAIHNTDLDHPITITSAKYYDTNGNFVTEYFDQPFTLAPLGMTSIVLERSDDRGGVGANFVVDWEAKTEVSEPVIEAVMVGKLGTKGLGFISPGRVIR
ncbi:MAG TPA: DUF3124 domain-containing protein [Anaerolineae bacterium]|nr:DUF3124 domain-containing protein [Anaerolineae bacterium]